MRIVRDLSFSAVSAGFVTVLVGFTSSAVIVFQAARSFGATPEQVGSWMLALCVGMGVPGVVLSTFYRVPVALAWSTSGAAMMATNSLGMSMSEAIGAFLVTGVLIIICGLTRWFERVMEHIPMSLGAGMLAGVLLRFGLDAFGAARSRFWLILVLFVVYTVARRFAARYAVLCVLCLGCLIVSADGTLDLSNVHMSIAQPVFVVPTFTLRALIGLALPLFIVTMASQNAPAVAVLRGSGFQYPISTLISWTGIATVSVAAFGGYTINLATITSAICIGPEAHEQPARRYVAGIFAGLFYLLAGLFGTTVGALFAVFPKELVLAVAGFALLGTIGNSIASAVQNEETREPAVVTFLATASGFSAFGIGSAFWGLVAGALSSLLLNGKLSQRASITVDADAKPEHANDARQE
jgi:benzoate membrane transport protein